MMEITRGVVRRRRPGATARIRGIGNGNANDDGDRNGNGNGNGNDDGTSLIELVVGMMLMSVFLAMFTGAVLAMDRAENKTEAVSLTSSQLNQAFMSLDKTVRYAAAISQPGTGTAPSGGWYVELRSTNSGVERCTQLHTQLLDPNDPNSWQLLQRTWTAVPTGTPAVSGWTPLASNLKNGAATDPATTPFVLKPLGNNDINVQQLTFNLVAMSGTASNPTQSNSSFTLTAADSTVPPPTGPICAGQRS